MSMVVYIVCEIMFGLGIVIYEYMLVVGSVFGFVWCGLMMLDFVLLFGSYFL